MQLKQDWNKCGNKTIQTKTKQKKTNGLPSPTWKCLCTEEVPGCPALVVLSCEIYWLQPLSSILSCWGRYWVSCNLALEVSMRIVGLLSVREVLHLLQEWWMNRDDLRISRQARKTWPPSPQIAFDFFSPTVFWQVASFTTFAAF